MKPRRRPWVRSAHDVRGVTLVELILFIVIAGVIASAMVQAFSATMSGSHIGKEMTQATQLAMQRMDVIQGQRDTLGYSGFAASADYDPCSSGAWTAQMCALDGFTVSSNRTVDGCGTNCTEVVVTATGTIEGGIATLTSHFWNFNND